MPTRSDPATPWRRRAFIAIVAALSVAAATLTLVWPGGEPETPGAEAAPIDDALGEEADGPAVPPPAAPEVVVPDVPPYFLAWTPGGLPIGFRERVRTLIGLEATVVFAGNTIWLTGSADEGGTVVDDPRVPFAIPIDAFAVNPVELTPFLPEGVRGSVVDALSRGKAVLGARSAAVRGLGVGGTLTFGQRSVSVGAVVPEEVIGWSELLVSRDVGERLGVVDDRHLWAFPSGDPGLPAFEHVVRELVPEPDPLRVERPGGSGYMRVASGVNPPIVLKEVFGEFAAALDPENPASFRIDPAWVDANLVTRSVPLVGRLTCHRVFMADLLEAIREVRRAGLAASIHSSAGCFNARTVARSPTNPPSFHAYGAAVDINAPQNAFGATPTMDPEVVAIFERRGFTWGGRFLIPDGMHFEYGGDLPAAG